MFKKIKTKNLKTWKLEMLPWQQTETKKIIKNKSEIKIKVCVCVYMHIYI